MISIRFLLLLLPFCLWTSLVQAAATDCTQVTEIPQIECEALIALYNSTNGPGWNNHAGWNTNNTPCSWYGIKCLRKRVTSIDLKGNNLIGPIPTEIGNLGNLKGLRLYNNQLSGSILPEISNLRNLQILWLDNNHLIGPISPELGKLSNLQILSLSYNQLSDSIPPELGNFNHLRVLDLSNNQLSGLIPPELGKLSNLVLLWLYKNQLSGPVPSELGNLSNLISIYLRNNQLRGPIPPDLGNLNKLQGLILSNNQLCGDIPFSLTNLTNLQVISLQNNALNIENLDPALEAFLNSHHAIWQSQNPAPADCHALLATLASFEAYSVSTGVLLQWQTLVETDNAGFFIWRGQPTGSQCSSHPADYHEIVQIGFEISKGNGFSGTTYFHQDNTVEPETTYCYLLEDINFESNGTFHWDSIASVTTP